MYALPPPDFKQTALVIEANRDFWAIRKGSPFFCLKSEGSGVAMALKGTLLVSGS